MRWTVGAAGLLIFLFQKTNPSTGSAATEAMLAWPTESGSGAPQRPAASGLDLRYRRQENMNIEKPLNNVDALRRRLEVCTKGRYIVLNSSSTCRDCPNGQFGETQNCRDISCCKACTKGQYAPQQDKGCEMCEKGMYQENDVAQEYQCKRCSNDLEYVSTVSACRECSSGRYSNATPVGLGESPCSICPMGKATGKLTGQRSCFPICTESLRKAADVPCVPAKNNKSNPCTYAEQYFNNSKELRSDQNEYERCEPWYVRIAAVDSFPLRASSCEPCDSSFDSSSRCSNSSHE